MKKCLEWDEWGRMRRGKGEKREESVIIEKKGGGCGGVFNRIFEDFSLLFTY